MLFLIFWKISTILVLIAVRLYVFIDVVGFSNPLEEDFMRLDCYAMYSLHDDKYHTSGNWDEIMPDFLDDILKLKFES